MSPFFHSARHARFPQAIHQQEQCSWSVLASSKARRGDAEGPEDWLTNPNGNWRIESHGMDGFVLVLWK